jgi:hypothetical protein
MAQNDDAVLTAAVGYVYVGPVGAAAPSPASLKTINPQTFGSQIQKVKVNGTPTGGTFTLTVGAQTTAPIAFNAGPSVVRAALELLSTVGVGNALVTGVGVLDAGGVDVAWTDARSGSTSNITSTAPSLTGGTSPAVVITQVQAVSEWQSVGHTSRGTLPEFGYDGGDTETKGSWQKKKLREISQDDAVDYVTVVLHQFDSETLALYYGENLSTVPGVFSVGSSPEPLERAGLVIIEDGDLRLGFHFHKASVKRDDAIELPIDDLASMPVKFKFLDYGDEALFSWINADLFA